MSAARSRGVGLARVRRVQSVVAGLVLAGLLAGASPARPAGASLSAKHKKWLEEEVVYIISDDEKKIFRELPNEAERERFIEQFWLARDPTPGTPENEYRDEHYRRIAYADQYYSEGRGEYGWRSDRGRIYIMLGPPAQVTKWPWTGQVRATELWFYSNTHPSLPGFFNVLFFQPDDASDYRLYSPVVDGPTKLAKGSGTENNPRGAFEQLRGVSAELARASLTLLTDEPIDLENFTATMSSDALLTRIFNLPNDRFTKEMLQRRQELREVVKTRVSFEPQAMQVEWFPLREADGDTAVHLVLLLPVTLEQLAAQSKDKYAVTARVSVLVRTLEGEQLFQQAHTGTYTYLPKDYERLRELPFAYEDKLPLPPGDYDVDFVFHNEISGDYYLARQRLSVRPIPAALALSPPVPYEEATRAEEGSAAGPFEFFGLRFVPSARSEFGRGENLKVFFQIYLPQPGPSYPEGESLEVEYTLGMPTGGQRRSESEQIAKRQFDAQGTVLHGKTFSLSELPAGAHRLVVKVTDPATKQSAAQTLPLKVVGLQKELGRTTIVNGRLAEDARLGRLDYRRGLCEAGLKHPQAAVRYLERALARNPKLEAARDKLATLLFAQGELSRVAALAQAASITPETPVETVTAFLHSLERTGNLDPAIALAERAVGVLAPNGILYEELAALYEKSGQPVRAREMREEARRAVGPEKKPRGEDR